MTVFTGPALVRLANVYRGYLTIDPLGWFTAVGFVAIAAAFAVSGGRF